ncbi:MAG: alpha/beta hydrolase [Thermoanaerobacterium sp.]|nr:alpha/beta hydrolase [Thermoanaerobacterium sp.]
MPFTIIGGKNIYYEVYGEGEPIIFLNGIMMSTISWAPFIDTFSKDFKLILIDFVDMGQSEKSTCDYPIDYHTETLKDLIKNLGIEKAHILGVSYGGEVALLFALKYSKMIKSLILANTSAYTGDWLKEIGELWDSAASTYNVSVFFNATMPYIYSREFIEENIKWIKSREELFGKYFTKDWYNAFRRLNRSSFNYDVRNEIHKIKVPTMVIGADKDILLPLRLQEFIHEKIENSKMVIIKDSGHASMYEKPYEFASIVMGYIKTYNQQIKII